jgi:hypothetical protein
MSSSRSGTLFLAVLSLLLLPIHAGRADSFIGYAEKEGEGVAAGATGGAAGRRVVLHTTWGPIPIELLEENAPKATQLVWDLAQRRGCERCRFYRNEARPPPDSAGPPYALLQGSIEQLDDSPTFEGLLKLPVKYAGSTGFSSIVSLIHKKKRALLKRHLFNLLLPPQGGQYSFHSQHQRLLHRSR